VGILELFPRARFFYAVTSCDLNSFLDIYFFGKTLFSGAFALDANKLCGSHVMMMRVITFWEDSYAG
jgi:hypothetical protein